MEEKEEWIPYQEIDWDCEKNNRFWIDTRDFHAGYRWDDEPHPDSSTLEKYDDFFYTKEEMLKILDRLYTESGGKCEWRYLSLKGGIENWNLKYIRIQRTPRGFIICDSEWRALRHRVFEAEVNTDLLHNH